MKKIKLRPEMIAGNDRITSLSVLRLVASNSPQRPLTVDEMRRRVRILDVLDELNNASDSVTLEDEDVKTLIAAIEAFPWSNANKNILAIIDDVYKAETLPPPMKLVEKKSE